MAVQQNNQEETPSVVLLVPSTVGGINRHDEAVSNNDSGYFSPSPVVSVETTKRLPRESDDDGPVDSSRSMVKTPVSLAVKLASRHRAISLFSMPSMRRLPKAPNCREENPPTRRRVVTLVNRIVSPHLIGHFVGRRRVDIIRELALLNLGHVASNVTYSLSPSELHVACQVSRTWRDTCLAEPSDRKRLRAYLLQRQQEKENTSASIAKLKDDVERDHEPLLLLSEAQNRLPNVAGEPSVSKDMARFMRFTEEAKNLDVHQKLDKCPRCASPARINPQQSSAECRSINGCGFFYCIRCRCERSLIDDRHVCDPLSPPRLAEVAALKSRQERKTLARKNLRRLLS